MPLEIKSFFKRPDFRACDDPKCTRLAGKEFRFMTYYLGTYCQKCAKQLVETWNECSSVESVDEEGSRC